jgi:hypothetical protein
MANVFFCLLPLSAAVYAFNVNRFKLITGDDIQAHKPRLTLRARDLHLTKTFLIATINEVYETASAYSRKM